MMAANIYFLLGQIANGHRLFQSELRKEERELLNALVAVGKIILRDGYYCQPE